MTKKRVWIITAVTLAVYTGAVILCFAFIRGRDKNADKNTNNAWSRSYTYVDYTTEEKAGIYQGIGLDIGKLTARGFAPYREDFLTPFNYPKELHVIELSFEDIYCNVSVYVHADEIKWERERETPTYFPLEVIGLQFERSTNTLRYDDTKHGAMFVFYCAAEPNDALYQAFLQIIFDKETE